MPAERRPSSRLFAPILLAALAAVPEAALAQGRSSGHSTGRPSTLDMTCGQARSYLSSRGAAVLGTGGYTYDRFVRDRSFCEPTQVTQNAFVPTRDTPECLVGYRCIEPGRDWFGDDE